MKLENMSTNQLKENIVKQNDAIGDQMNISEPLITSQYQKTKLDISHLQQKIKQDHNIIKKTKRVFIGTGFTFDLTQFFKFRKVKQVESGGQFGSIFYQISGGGLSWAILIYSVINSSFICVWILASKSSKFLLLAWRFIFQAFLMIPFVLHEKRTISFQNSHKYSLRYLLKPNNLKKLYLSSLSTTLWYGIILTAGQWTYMSHALYLGSLVNFFLSLSRHRGRNCHEYQIGGQVAIVVGIFFVFLDTIYFRYDQIKPEQLSHTNNYYLHHTVNQRLGADIIAIVASIIMAKFSQINTGIIYIFPPYLSLMIIDIINFINMIFLCFFFNGLTFDTTKEWGFFSLFTSHQFTIFLYGAIVLCVGLVISFSLISRLFPNFVMPSIAFFFQPGISTILLNFFKVQALPRSFSLIGYTIMTPGMLLILFGQWLFIRKKKKQEILQRIKLTQLQQIIHKKYDQQEPSAIKLYSSVQNL